MDEDILELEVNWLGNLFVFQRRRFQEFVHTLPDERKERLKELATHHSLAKVQVNMSKSNFESHFLSANHAAYAWQYEVLDSDYIYIYIYRVS